MTFTIYSYVQYDWWLDPGHVTPPSGGIPRVDFWGCDRLVSEPLVIENLVLIRGKRLFKTRL